MMIKTTLFILLLVACCIPGKAQSSSEIKTAREILTESLYLYQLEKASWLASDLMVSKYPKAKIEGYVSYRDNNHYTAIFYASADQNYTIVKSFRFDSTFNKTTVVISENERPATDREKKLIELRTKAALEILAPPQLFEMYDKISLNIEVLEMPDGSYKVYGLSGTTEPGYVPLGNDFMIEYSKDLQIGPREKLHNSFFPLDMNGKTLKDMKKFTPMHTHVDKFSPYITATDICQVLLYSDLYDYRYELVISDKYLSIFFIKEKQLKIFKVKDEEELLEYINKYCPE
jgi:hypothetical protein